MTDSGWFKVYYKLRDSDLWLSEKFTRGQAWVDLLMLARWKEEPGFMRKRGCKTQINQGQVAWSEKGLADRWGWSRGKVRRFLSELEEEAQIEQQKTNITTLINITNFNKYQGSSTANKTPSDTANGHQIEQQTDTKEEGKKGRREELEESSTQSELTSGTSVPEAVSLPATSNNGVPAKKIAELWNSKQVENGSTLPKLAKINPKTQRYRHLRARWNEHPDMQTWELVVDKATKSDFLNGRVAKFQASFDWVVKSADNFTKTLEGNYDNKKDKAGSATGMTLEQFKEEFNMEIDSLSELEYWVGKGTIRADQKRRFQQ